MNRFVWGTGDNRVRVWRRPGPFLNGFQGQFSSKIMLVRIQQELLEDFLRHCQTLPFCKARSPDLSPVGTVGTAKTGRCHRVTLLHDLELAVQDLWAICLRTTWVV
ncbi:hypothetical protein TNCV_1111831 [Trichonephila clavipes]|nr:hypothetical protein TNCV_1111831 [Trichonephila clavipes]